MKFLSRAFHSSTTLNQLPNHKLFKLIDWDRIEAGDYAVVNPADPAEVLYLTERDYIVQVRVSMTQNHRLLTLATPSSRRPSNGSNDPEFKNSPPSCDGETNISSFKRVFATTFRWVKKISSEDGKTKTTLNMVVVTERNLLTLLDLWSKIVWSRIEGLKSSGKFRREVWAFAKTCTLLLRRHGVTELITRLRLYLFVVSSYVAGTPLKSTEDLGKRIRLSHGLPKILPLRARILIRNRDRNAIRIWSSIFYIYKTISDIHKAPHFDVIASRPPIAEWHYIRELPSFKDFSPRFVEWLYSLTGIKPWLKIDLIPKSLFSASSAGPNCSWGLGGLPLDTLAWLAPSWGPGNPLWDYMTAVGDDIGINMFMEYARKLLLSWYPVKHAYDLVERMETGGLISKEELSTVHNKQFVPGHILSSDPKYKSKPYGKLKSLLLGKLAALPESAGKVRIIAIVDCWTQTYLSPIHDFFFDILKKIPCDATFDQQGAVNEFAKKGYKDLYSYDLSAATDTIPYTLYEIVMEPFFGKVITNAWLNLLRSRDWLLPMWKTPDSKRGEQLLHEGSDTIRYNRGQPMGAKSSWGALALVHHALVQYAAFSIGLFPFTDYLILGDDIVIANKDVALEYRDRSISLGVRIGLAKSFTSSEGFFNFASQSVHNDVNLSPLSFREELASTGISSRMESLWSAVDRGFLTVTANDFFAKAVRWLVPPRFLQKIEDDRKRGVLNEVGKWCATAIFLSILEGNKHFHVLEGLAVSDVVKGFLNPKTSLFSQAVTHSLSTTSKKSWLTYSGELSLLFIDRYCRDIGKKLLEKGNIIRALIGQPPVEELSSIEWTPPALGIDREFLGIETDREKDLKGHVSSDPDKILSEHIQNIEFGAVRDSRNWSYLSLRIFGCQVSLSRVLRITDKLVCQMGSINPAIQLFSSELVLKLAKVLIPDYNKLVLQHSICSQKMRHFLGNMPHLIPQVMAEEIELLKWLEDSAEIPFGVLAAKGKESKIAASDAKMIDILLLTDKVRFLKQMESVMRQKQP